ncbi:MAG: preprotein translocase subunit SecG [Candidatus Woykebacteria bacterium RIFCSPHIGHO2_12_FULL_45_10]|uniref:Protein-export membrane protein SecG n=1 Tax=Candidatus Woykebacteria bacterium RIFCSPHIGHO2_12_FULL_45_10 TaxID=1802603 RepID=A0A1G1WN95_9BACT|nr:MAG: preprotein translocase subunit SecG [Candidatus Woykebacteria bacterium RIFCSPHIGHO2_12_FULL_45_10]
MLQNALLGAQIIVAALLVTTIIMQNKGSGVGSVFGGESVVYRSRRGVEKLLHYSTIILAIVFATLSLSSVLLG